MRCALLLIIPLLLTGCAGTPGTPDGSDPSSPTAASPTGTSSSSDAASDEAPTAGSSVACEGGAGDVFLATSHGAGAMPDAWRPRLVEVGHDGAIRVLWGHTEPGPGETTAEEGALDGLTLEEAGAMLARRGFTYEDNHLVIERGDEAVIPAASFASFCARVVETLPKLQDAYAPAAGCDMMPVVTWDVSTTAGERTLTVSDCADEASPGLAAFRALQRDHDRLVGPG